MRHHLYAHYVPDIAFSKRQAPSWHWPGQVAIVPIVPERHSRSATEFTSNIFSTTIHLSDHSSPCAPCSSRTDDVFYKWRHNKKKCKGLHCLPLEVNVRQQLLWAHSESTRHFIYMPYTMSKRSSQTHDSHLGILDGATWRWRTICIRCPHFWAFVEYK